MKNWNTITGWLGSEQWFCDFKFFYPFPTPSQQSKEEILFVCQKMLGRNDLKLRLFFV